MVVMGSAQGVVFQPLNTLKLFANHFLFNVLAAQSEQFADKSLQSAVTSEDNSVPPEFPSFDYCSQKYLIL